MAHSNSKKIINADVVKDAQQHMPTAEEFADMANLHKMLASETRVRIIWALQRHEMCVCDLSALLGMTKSATSHQLKLLRLSNVVKSRREGQIIYYSLLDHHIEDIFTVSLEHIQEG
ncbi:MAG: metalloregulator ArsR/SmtB family transcription factor [Coriobacteriia bacterium]|nr:metalloregulator ArsR/SmtB family transcription factor [Coriobacteriia bacterium]MCL2870346.1 metalloregulator ArsR/SmtB family transcription factor [Coriobacteriia bacterium]